MYSGIKLRNKEKERERERESANASEKEEGNVFFYYYSDVSQYQFKKGLGDNHQIIIRMAYL